MLDANALSHFTGPRSIRGEQAGTILSFKIQAVAVRCKKLQTGEARLADRQPRLREAHVVVLRRGRREGEDGVTTNKLNKSTLGVRKRQHERMMEAHPHPFSRRNGHS